MGLIEERGEGQPKHEGGRGDESPGEKEERRQRSRQPEFPSWQVSFSAPSVPREGRAGVRGCRLLRAIAAPGGWGGRDADGSPGWAAGTALGTGSGCVRWESDSVEHP